LISQSNIPEQNIVTRQDDASVDEEKKSRKSLPWAKKIAYSSSAIALHLPRPLKQKQFEGWGIV